MFDDAYQERDTGRDGLALALLSAVVLGIACALLCAGVAVADEAGRRLAQSVYDRPDGSDATSLATMTLTERGAQPRLRRFVAYRSDRGGAGVASLVRFTEPGDISGTGLLTLDPTAGDSEQWLYLPALQRVRRVAGDRKGGRFVGSDYYYEDLRDRKVSEDSHRIVGQDTVSGVRCDLLESVPVEAGNSVYRKRLSCIDPARLLPMRIDLFEKSGESPSKRWTLDRAEQIQGYWTVVDSTMADLETGHETRLVVERALYDRGLPDDLFSSRILEDEVRESRYRP